MKAHTIIAAIVGRGGRFFLIGGLIFFYGESFQGFFAEYFDKIIIGSGAVLLVAFAAFIVVSRYRKSRANGAARQGSLVE